MRIKNTRPTFIYWLVDTRTNTPFYCGKTVELPEERLRNHKKDARKWPSRPLTARLNECGQSVVICVMEVVPPDGDWVAREKRWIYLLRETIPNCVNVSDGGVGVPGLVHSPETRERLRKANLGKKQSPETCAKKSLASSNYRHSPEARAKISAGNKGKTVSEETRERIGAASKGRKHSLETLIKMSTARKGKPGKKHSAETRANMSVARQGRKHSEAARAKMSASQFARHRGDANV